MRMGIGRRNQLRIWGEGGWFWNEETVTWRMESEIGMESVTRIGLE